MKIDPRTITDETPLRLDEAAAIAFPAGNMTASGLRKEASRGRLVVEMIAGKQFTTLAAIKEMRKLCRVEPKVLASNSVPPAKTKTDVSPTKQHGASATDGEISAQDALRAKLTPRNAR